MTVQIRQDGKCVIEGVEYPGVGYGTWPLRDDVCFQAILDAARIGYRIIDTATLYGNHVPIGKALKKLGREQYYVTSKVWPNNHRPQDLKKDLVKALEDLQTSYLDAYLLHWPNSKTPIEDTMEAMVAAQKAGLIRHIGLSNVTPNHLKRIFELKVPITWVQNEMHPHFYEPSEVQACTSHGIGFQAWGPLGRGRLVEDSLLKKFSRKTSQNTRTGCLTLDFSASRFIPPRQPQSCSHAAKLYPLGFLAIERGDGKDRRSRVAWREGTCSGYRTWLR